MIQQCKLFCALIHQPALKFSTPSSLSLQLEGDETLRFSVYDDDDHTNTFNRGKIQQNATLEHVKPDRRSATTPSLEFLHPHKTETKYHLTRSDKAERSQSTSKIFAPFDDDKPTEPQNKLIVAGSRGNGGNLRGHDNTTTTRENRLENYTNSSSKGPFPASENETKDRHSPNFSQCKTGLDQKPPNLVLETEPSSSYHSSNYKNQDITSISTFVPSFDPSLGSSCLRSSGSNHISVIHQDTTKSSLRNTHNLRANSQEQPDVSDGFKTIETNLSNTSASQTNAINHGPDPSGPSVFCTSSSNDKQNPTTEHHCPVQGHRKKNRNRFSFKSAASHYKFPSGSSSTHRQTKKKTKGTNSASNGDAESHDSGINDVFN